jgi:hypothetical protein
MTKNLRLFGFSALVLMMSLMSQSAKADMCEAKYFSCKVGGKVVSLCGAQLGDVFNIMLNIGTETVAEIGQGEKIYITDYAAGQAGLSSVHLKANGTIYALTKCDGMECNPDKDTWVSIVKGKKKIKGSGFCEPGSSTGFTNLPLIVDKKGNRVIDKKSFLADYFSITKNPKESFLTENISWSD